MQQLKDKSNFVIIEQNDVVVERNFEAIERNSSRELVASFSREMVFKEAKEQLFFFLLFLGDGCGYVGC